MMTLCQMARYTKTKLAWHHDFLDIVEYIMSPFNQMALEDIMIH